MNLATLELGQGLLDPFLGHGEGLGDGLDPVQSGKVQHLPVNRSGGDEGTLDGDPVGDEGHVGDGKVAVRYGEGVDL